MTTTDRDIRAQVQQAVDASAITEAIVRRYGLVDIDSIDHDEFWSLVDQHATD